MQIECLSFISETVAIQARFKLLLDVDRVLVCQIAESVFSIRIELDRFKLCNARCKVLNRLEVALTKLLQVLRIDRKYRDTGLATARIVRLLRLARCIDWPCIGSPFVVQAFRRSCRTAVEV